MIRKSIKLSQLPESEARDFLLKCQEKGVELLGGSSRNLVACDVNLLGLADILLDELLRLKNRIDKLE